MAHADRHVDHLVVRELEAPVVIEVGDRSLAFEDEDHVLRFRVYVRHVALAGLEADVGHVRRVGADAGPDYEARVLRDHGQHQIGLVPMKYADGHSTPPSRSGCSIDPAVPPPSHQRPA
jgi:hypothetical protein